MSILRARESRGCAGQSKGELQGVVEGVTGASICRNANAASNAGVPRSLAACLAAFRAARHDVETPTIVGGLCGNLVAEG